VETLQQTLVETQCEDLTDRADRLYIAYFEGCINAELIKDTFDKVNDFYSNYPDRFDSKAFKIASDRRLQEI
jgi:CO dehydrogenase/acetyl-CoA synthase alpha subunit